MKSIAERTGGRYADIDRFEAGSLLASMSAPRRERLALSRRPLWSSPAWLALLGAALVLEWLLRRRAGLL